MRKKAIVSFIAAALLSAAGCTQDARSGPGPGPGYGPGHGPMMGGYGPMMGGGYGGPYGGGPMMGGWDYRGLRDLTPEQRTKVGEIQRDFRAKQWPIMQQMHELMWSDAGDEQAQRRDYDKLAGLQKQMFENSVDMRKRVEAVLTQQQRDELRRGGGPAR